MCEQWLGLIVMDYESCTTSFLVSIGDDLVLQRSSMTMPFPLEGSVRRSEECKLLGQVLGAMLTFQDFLV